MRSSRLAIGSYRGERGHDLAAPRRRRQSRRRVLLRLGALVVTLALLAGGGYWLLTAPTFAIERVESGFYRFSSEAEVAAAFDRIIGQNIWTLTRSRVVAACADLPWVREVHLVRRLPDTVVIEFVEWQPLLAVAAESAPEDAGLLVADGRVLANPAHLDVPGLPLLVGCRTVDDPDAGPRLTDEDLAPLLDLVRAVQDTGLEAVRPVDFVRRTAEGFVLELQGRAGSLQLGHGDFARRLNRYLLTPDQIPAGSVVDLRFEDRTTIRKPEPDRT